MVFTVRSERFAAGKIRNWHLRKKNMPYKYFMCIFINLAQDKLYCIFYIDLPCISVARGGEGWSVLGGIFASAGKVCISCIEIKSDFKVWTLLTVKGPFRFQVT